MEFPARVKRFAGAASKLTKSEASGAGADRIEGSEAATTTPGFFTGEAVICVVFEQPKRAAIPSASGQNVDVLILCLLAGTDTDERPATLQRHAPASRSLRPPGLL